MKSLISTFFFIQLTFAYSPIIIQTKLTSLNQANSLKKSIKEQWNIPAEFVGVSIRTKPCMIDKRTHYAVFCIKESKDIEILLMKEKKMNQAFKIFGDLK